MLLEQVNQYFNCVFDKFEFNSTFARTGKKKEFWAIGTEFQFHGQSYYFISAGNWKTGERKNFKSWNKDLELKDKSFRKKVNKESGDLQSKLNLEEEKKWTAARDKALEDMKEFSKDVSSVQYLSLKKVKAYGNLLCDFDENLIIPTYEDDESIVGYQKITHQGKWFQTGQKMRGVFFPIGNIQRSEVIYIAEGYATAATIHELTGYPVVVAFTCHNISPVIRSIHQTYGHKKIVIAADNDEKNAGEICAKKACKAFSSVQYVMPRFGNDLTELSDFNDLFNAEGAARTMQQLAFDSSKFNHVSMLGHSEGRYYFYSERSKEVRDFSLAEMRAGDLVAMAKENYWASKYRYKAENPDACDWKATTEILVDHQEQEVGFFSPDKVRGFGFWKDGQDYIFNNGKAVFKNGDKVNFGYVNKNFFYTPSGACSVSSKEFSPRIFQKIKEALDLTDFRSEKDRIGFLGFIAQAPVFSCMDWKSHIWFVGPAGSGKTTVLSFLDQLLVNSKFFQDSTAAGIRQTIKNDALVTIVDEAEGDERNTKRLMDMARHSSRGQDITVARGTPTGRAISQNVTTVFCFGSIQQPTMSIADESRVLNVSLKVNKGRVDINKEEKRKDAYFEASNLGDELFYFMTQNVELYKKKIEDFKRDLLLCGASTRQADQNANLLAGYWMLSQDENPDDIVNRFLKSDSTVIQEVENFNDEVIDSIKFLKIRDGNSDVLLGDMIQRSFGPASPQKEYAENFLRLFGIKIVKDEIHFTKNNSLKKEMERVGIANYWSTMRNDKDHFHSSMFKWPGAEKPTRSYKISKNVLTN